MKNNTVYMPDENIVVSLEVTAEQPFNKCFECHSFRNGCSGPNLSAMSVSQACEFLQLVRAFRDVTYQDISEASGVSLTTVKRILTGKVVDPSFYNISAISSYLMGDPKGNYPCAIPNVVTDVDNEAKLNDALRELELALHDNADYRAALDDIHRAYKVEMDAVRSEGQQQIEFLKEELKRAREDADNWRQENNRKAQIIDKHWDKILSR